MVGLSPAICRFPFPSSPSPPFASPAPLTTLDAARSKTSWPLSWRARYIARESWEMQRLESILIVDASRAVSN